MLEFKIENVAFCENARSEIGGKFTLLGVTAPELNMSTIPSVISIAIWISGVPSAPGPFQAEIRALDTEQNPLIKAMLKGVVSGGGRSSFVIGPMPIAINAVGNYTFEWKFEELDWAKIGFLEIKLDQNHPNVIPSSTA